MCTIFRWGTHLYMSLFPSVRPSICQTPYYRASKIRCTLVSLQLPCTYRAPKTSIRYTQKREPEINSDVCVTKILSIVKNYFFYWNQKAYLKNVYYKLSHMLIDLKKNHALMFESIYTFESTNRFIYEHICIDLGF